MMLLRANPLKSIAFLSMSAFSGYPEEEESGEWSSLALNAMVLWGVLMIGNALAIIGMNALVTTTLTEGTLVFESLVATSKIIFRMWQGVAMIMGISAMVLLFKSVLSWGIEYRGWSPVKTEIQNGKEVFR